MASIYTNLRTERQYRAATGLSEEKFNQLFEQFKHFYVPKKGNPASPFEPLFQDAREALFFILFYYKTYPTLQILGLQFGCSDKTAFEYLEYIKPFLKKALEADKRLAVEVFGSQAAFDKAFEGVKDIIIDGFEVPVVRDKDKHLQARTTVVKKMSHQDSVVCVR
jgi:hypothetical protein